jgi:Leucine-rich repeat (LRR) protein
MSSAAKKSLLKLPGERKHPNKRGPSADKILNVAKGVVVTKLSPQEIATILGKKKESGAEIDLSASCFQLDSVAWLKDAPDQIKEYVCRRSLLHPSSTNMMLANNRRMNLTGNQLTEFVHGQHLSHLKRLYLGQNSLVDVSFRGLKSCVQITLNDNRIEHLTDMTDLQKLENLDLSGNRLTSSSIHLIFINSNLVFVCYELLQAASF